MKFLINEQLGKHRYKTKEGYLVCVDAIIARTGKQNYRKNELFTDAEDDDTEIEVDRPYKEVFDEKTIASFENKPFVDEHPEGDVNVDNYRELSIGYIRDIHEGTDNGKPVLLANIIVTDPDAIREIESNEKNQLSCGYDCDIKQDENGNYYQSGIRGNHLALCETGRAGNARIQDSFSEERDKRYKIAEELNQEANRQNAGTPEKLVSILRKKYPSCSKEEMIRILNVYYDQFQSYYNNRAFIRYRIEEAVKESFHDSIIKDTTYTYEMIGTNKKYSNKHLSLEKAKFILKNNKELGYDGNIINEDTNEIIETTLKDSKGQDNSFKKQSNLQDNSFKKIKDGIKIIKGYKMPDMKDFDKHILKGSLEIWLKNGNVVAYYNEKTNETHINTNFINDSKDLYKIANKIWEKIKNESRPDLKIDNEINKYDLSLDEASEVNHILNLKMKYKDSIKDTKRWEVGQRVKYEGQWYYVINYSRGQWILESEDNNEQIRVDDSIKDSFTENDLEEGLYKSGSKVIQIKMVGKNDVLIDLFDYSKEYGKDYMFKNRRFDYDTLLNMLNRGYKKVNSYKDSKVEDYGKEPIWFQNKIIAANRILKKNGIYLTWMIDKFRTPYVANFWGSDDQEEIEKAIKILKENGYIVKRKNNKIDVYDPRINEGYYSNIKRIPDSVEEPRIYYVVKMDVEGHNKFLGWDDKLCNPHSKIIRCWNKPEQADKYAKMFRVDGYQIKKYDYDNKKVLDSDEELIEDANIKIVPKNENGEIHYEGYVNGKFICSGDTENETQNEIDKYLKGHKYYVYYRSNDNQNNDKVNIVQAIDENEAIEKTKKELGKNLLEIQSVVCKDSKFNENKAIKLVKNIKKIKDDYSGFLGNYGFDYLKGNGDYEYWYLKYNDEDFNKLVNRIRKEYPMLIISSSPERKTIYIQKSMYKK